MASVARGEVVSAEVQVHRILRAFEIRFGSHTPDRLLVARAPGRVNLIGDHTDYNEGFVLPMSIDRAVYVVLRERPDDVVHLHSLNFEEDVVFDLAQPQDVQPGSWKSYVLGAITELSRRRLLPSGFDMMISGDVPLGAGLSSSAATEVAVVFGLESLFEFDLDPLEAIRLCQLVEHRYAGVRCGIMDQFASRLGRRGSALYLDCRTLEHEHVPLPLAQAGLALVIADTRVKRELAGSKYGERRRECERFVGILRGHGEPVDSLRDASPEMLERYAVNEVLVRRARHVMEENARVQAAREALREGDFSLFGALMYLSHESLRDLYEVSCPELDLLVATARATEGALGARMTGGGFGGCTVNLVREESIELLCSALSDAYTKRFALTPEMYVLRSNVQAGVIYSVPGTR